MSSFVGFSSSNLFRCSAVSIRQSQRIKPLINYHSLLPLAGLSKPSLELRTERFAYLH
jgi:hypothetical protein